MKRDIRPSTDHAAEVIKLVDQLFGPEPEDDPWIGVEEEMPWVEVRLRRPGRPWVPRGFRPSGLPNDVTYLMEAVEALKRMVTGSPAVSPRTARNIVGCARGLGATHPAVAPCLAALADPNRDRRRQRLIAALDGVQIALAWWDVLQSFSCTARFLISVIGPTETAALVGVTRGTIRRWQRGESTPTGLTSARLGTVATAVRHLVHARNPVAVVGWFHQPCPHLDDAVPYDLLPDQSRHADVIAAAAFPGDPAIPPPARKTRPTAA